MARGKKGYEKTVRTVNKGQSAQKKIKTVHKMVETQEFLQNMIKGDLKAAEQSLANRVQQLFRAKVMGEGVVDLELEDGEDGESMDGYDEYSDDEGEGDREYDFEVDGSPDESMDDMDDEDGEYSDEEGDIDLDAEDEGDIDLELDAEDEAGEMDDEYEERM